MKIYQYIRQKAFSINYDDNYTILDIASLFLQTNNESIVILKDGKPIYIITNTDLINFFLQKDNSLLIKDIMRKYPKNMVLINKNKDIYAAYKQMRNLSIEHLIVVDDDGEFLGEVYQKDLIMKFVEFSLKDDLTCLNNSRFLETIIQKYNKTKTRIGVVFLDIDNFKQFNDKYGHEIGDKVIKIVAEKIKDSIREVDFGFRYGGDEFVIMVFEQDKDVVFKIAKRIFEKINSIEYDFGSISVSIGVSMYPDDNSDLRDVINLADKELYIAKNSGKGKIESVN